MPHARNEIPDEKSPPSAMFKPFTYSLNFVLCDVDPVTVSENQRIATDAPDAVRDSNTADTTEKCRCDSGCYPQLSLEDEVPEKVSSVSSGIGTPMIPNINSTKMPAYP